MEAPNQLIGASWDLLPWFVGAAIAFIMLHAMLNALAKHRAQRIVMNKRKR